MPATEAQILANKANAKRSSGPGPAGQRRSRLNATKHGLASELESVEADFSPQFMDRRTKWAAEHQPEGEDGNWAMDRVVAASLQIERCERAIDEVVVDVQERARLAWDEDRAVEAAAVMGRLAKDPLLASRKLQATLAGVELLIEAWLGLAATLTSEVDWSESEASKALDLLGVAPDLRSGQTLIDAPEESDSLTYHKELALEEIERLETLREKSMIPLDTLERRQAIRGNVALLSKEAKLLLRYERDAWKRYHDSMKELKGHASVEPPAVVTPAPVVERPKEASRALPAATARPVAKPVVKPDLLEELGLLADGQNPLPGSYVPITAGSPPRPATERTQSGGRVKAGKGRVTA